MFARNLAAAAMFAAISTPALAQDQGAADPGQAQREIQALREQVSQQQAHISRLEAKVGMPSGALSWTWFLVGLVGEGVFFMRFVVQWWASERRKRTVVPMAFWYLSLFGTALVLAYAVFVINPVFILAYSLNVFLYVRNLVIARRSPLLAASGPASRE